MDSLQDSPHVGKLITKRLEDLGMTKAEFGRRIQTSRQNVNSLLRNADASVSFLRKAGKALDHDFFRELACCGGPDGKTDMEVLTASAEAQASIAKFVLLLARGY